MRSDQCLVVMYHYVRDVERTKFPAIKALSVADFERQLDWIQEHYEVVDYRMFEEAVRGKCVLPHPSALLTFDDGLVDHYETVFPILHRRGLSGVFFVSDAVLAPDPLLLTVHKIHFLLAHLGVALFTAVVWKELNRCSVLPAYDHCDHPALYRYDVPFNADIKRLLNYELPYDRVDTMLDRVFREHLGDPGAFARHLYLTPPMVRALVAGGMTVGGHTVSHRVLSRLSTEEQEGELSQAIIAIRALTGQHSIPFCYPYGHRNTYNVDTLTHLQRLGYSLSFTAVRGLVHFGKDPLHELPRFDTKDLPPFVPIPVHA